jgi:membrane fusion protein
MATSLFRTVQADANLLSGFVDLRSPRWTVITGFLCLSLIVSAAFVAATPYARKQATIGLVVPQAGTVRVGAPQPGTLSALFVADGSMVEAGAALFTIDYRRSLQDGGTLDAALRRALDSQEMLLSEQIASEASRAANERAGLDSRIAGLDGERRGLTEQRTLLERRVRVAAERFEGVTDLRRRGLITETDFRGREDSWLARRQELSTADQRIDAIDHSTRQAMLQAAQLPTDSGDRIAKLRGAIAELQQHKIQASSQGGELVRAPVAGRVTALQAGIGQRVDPAKPLLALVPPGGVMRAELFVPSRAIGFVRSGQKVRLMFDAFPYQRFGTYGGIIDSVSESVLTPDQITGPLRPEGPVYRVSVHLDAPGVSAFGREVVLQPDMTLRADIVLEQRTILQWIFEPLLSLHGKLQS